MKRSRLSRKGSKVRKRRMKSDWELVNVLSTKNFLTYKNNTDGTYVLVSEDVGTGKWGVGKGKTEEGIGQSYRLIGSKGEAVRHAKRIMGMI